MSGLYVFLKSAGGAVVADKPGGREPMREMSPGDPSSTPVLVHNRILGGVGGL